MHTLEKGLRGVVLTGIFALPFVCLIISTSLFFPYITGKNFAFRIIVEIIAAAWLALALVKPAYRPARSWLLASFSAFVLIMAIADALGVAPFKSFWSNYERMDGWVSLAHMFVYFVVAASVMNTERLWTRLMQVSLGVSGYLSLYGLAQVTGALALGQGGGTGLDRRVDATFGNPIYLAVYMLFHIAMAALLWAQMYQERAGKSRMLFGSLYGSVIVLDTIALFLSGTRGAIFGLIGGILVAAATIAWQMRDNKTIRYISVGVVTSVVLLGGVFWMARNTAFVQDVGFLRRFTAINLNDNSTKARIMNWHIALKGVEERPLLGWGQENYAIVFDKYYDPQMYAQEPWFDRVHNVVFDWLVAGGILGLLAYLSILGAAVLMLWREKAFHPMERSILTGLIVAYFIHNFFVFDNVISYILFGTITAYIAWRSFAAHKKEHLCEKVHLAADALPYASVAAGVIAIIAIWGINGTSYAQNTALLQTLTPTTDTIDQALARFVTTANMGGFGTQETREQFAQITAQLAQNKSLTNEQKLQWLTAAADQLTKQEAQSPLDARFPFFKGILYGAYGDYAHASSSLARALELAPGKQLILFEAAHVDELTGNVDGALQKYKQAFEVAPENTIARQRYAAAAIRAKKDSIAEDLLAPLAKSGNALNADITAAYAARGKFDRIAALGETNIAAHPQDLQAYLTLAAAYYSVHDIEKTIAVLKKAKEAIPAKTADIDTLITQVQNGTAQ